MDGNILYQHHGHWTLKIPLFPRYFWYAFEKALLKESKPSCNAGAAGCEAVGAFDMNNEHSMVAC
jgi:hypothetical protein